MHSVLHMLTSPNERADEIPCLDDQVMQVQPSPLDGSVAPRVDKSFKEAGLVHVFPQKYINGGSYGSPA